MSTSYGGLGRLVVTFPEENSSRGQVCKLNDEGAVEACAHNERFFGVVHEAEEGMASVQVEGFVTMWYSGPAPAIGYTKLAANGFGGVCASASGWEYLVVQVDTSYSNVTFKL